MGFARTRAMSLNGLEGTEVDVETHISQGLPGFTIVGLPDSSTLQARERVRSACQFIGHPLGDRKLTVNLSPAWIPKSGSGFDLAIAISALASLGVIHPSRTRSMMFIGELTLDAQVRAVPGILPALMVAVKRGIESVCVPAANEAEARLVPGIQVHAVHTLEQAVLLLGGKAKHGALRREISATPADPVQPNESPREDFADVHGQSEAKKAAEVAAAGGHHMLLIGPPGAGKTMIASRIPTILPPLSDERALELSAIASICGAFDARHGLVRTSPFVAPHHTATVPAVIGGGAGIAGPGAVSTAHGGVLFLDEAPEFSPRVLESLREVLESGEITLHRSRGATKYPAAFQLVLAANPCPCGRSGVAAKSCECTSQQQRRYRSRISGPILDRLDLRVSVPPAHASREGSIEETSATIRERVTDARARQARRLRGTEWDLNAKVPASYLNARMRLGEPEEALLLRSVEMGRLSMRGRDRIRRISWTLADLDGAAIPSADHFSQAVRLRGESW